MDFDRTHQPGLLSRIGGAANSGSAKPPQERARLDREHQQRQQDSQDEAASAREITPRTTDVANEQRTDDRPGPHRPE